MIDRLPIELQILVAENLQSQGGRYNLAVSSRRSYVDILRVLYSEVSLGNGHCYKVTQASGFLNTILRRPELAKAVRSEFGRSGRLALITTKVHLSRRRTSRSSSTTLISFIWGFSPSRFVSSNRFASSPVIQIPKAWKALMRRS